MKYAYRDNLRDGSVGVIHMLRPNTVTHTTLCGEQANVPAIEKEIPKCKRCVRIQKARQKAFFKGVNGSLSRTILASFFALTER